ncbi:MAG TPA: cation transporter [Terriglobales bacterium]|nr:cation transporter [Terriglobales bacterium]HYL65460.1 cation transporter [Candidatus Methylomirabilis sp.]
MKIEILYFDGCPNHELMLDRVRDVLKEEGIFAEVSELNIQDDPAAQAARFLGSPSLRINGLDVEPEARTLNQFGMMCRTYLDTGRRVGLPPRELIRNAVRETAQARSPQDCCEVPVVATAQTEPAVQQRKWVLGASVTAAIGASLCCILPILTAVTGVGVLATGAMFERWRPYLLAATVSLLGAGFLLVYRDRRKACAPGSVCATRPVTRWSLISLCAVGVLAAGVAAFPYYSGAVARALIGEPPSNGAAASTALATVTFQIPDMDCAACAVSLSTTFRRLPGVAEAKLDVDSRKAVVTYDPAAQDVPKLRRIISEAGFHIASESRL